jgi:dolichol-phosphate mannosyltransferase
MISVIIPASNEGEGIGALYQRLSACAQSWNEDYEVILVDDGSTDDTLEQLTAIATRDPHWRVLSLSRNFGHQPAVTAGLEHACGDLVAVLDADLQDPPEELPRFFAKARQGYDVVYGIRTRRKEGPLKRLAYFSFYRFLAVLAEIDIPVDSGDFCVMTRRVVDALNALPERSRFLRGLRSWVGFPQTGLTYERHVRFAGAPRYTLAKLVKLALEGMISFSSHPLRLIALAGLGLGALAILLAALVLTQYVLDWTILGYNPRQARGWTSLMLVLLFLGSAQLVSIGILGEYIGRIFEEIKRRPVYVIDRRVNCGGPTGTVRSADEVRAETRP